MSKLGQILGSAKDKFGFFFTHHRSFTLLEIGSGLGKFFIVYAAAFLGITIPVLIRITEGKSIDLSQLFSIFTTDQFIDGLEWNVIGISALCIAIVNQIKESIVVKKKTTQKSRLIYACIGGAIEELVRMQLTTGKKKKYFINEVLRYIEKVVTQILLENGVPPGEICANLMIKRQDPDRLVLEYFGTYLTGRDYVVLDLDPQLKKPGAPEAYFRDQVMYVDNTLSPRFKNNFKADKSYRSIISYPISVAKFGIFAILNIDSDLTNQFQSEKVIKTDILPAITPFILLIKLHRSMLQSMQPGDRT